MSFNSVDFFLIFSLVAYIFLHNCGYSDVSFGKFSNGQFSALLIEFLMLASSFPMPNFVRRTPSLLRTLNAGCPRWKRFPLSHSFTSFFPLKLSLMKMFIFSTYFNLLFLLGIPRELSFLGMFYRPMQQVFSHILPVLMFASCCKECAR